MKHTSMSDEYTGRAIKSSKYSVIVTDVVWPNVDDEAVWYTAAVNPSCSLFCIIRSGGEVLLSWEKDKTVSCSNEFSENEVYDNVSDMWSNTCTGCGMTIQFENLWGQQYG